MDAANWAAMKEGLVAVFKTKSRDEWSAIMEGTDVCFAPVLTMSEATQHPHMVARDVFMQHDGHTQPAPAPRFSRTPSSVRPAETMELGAAVKGWSAR
jgi:alpha-methylacyl-CoA racemase